MEGRIEAFDEGLQLVHGAVLLADFADLAADRHRHAWRLDLPNERGQLRTALVVVPLLLGKRGERQVDQS